MAGLATPGFVSTEGTLGKWKTDAPDDFDFSPGRSTDTGAQFFPVTRLRQQYIDYLTAKVLEYEEQKESRHYFHGSQWNPEDIRILKARRQPIVTFNRINRKIDSIVGLVQKLRQDPKAFATSPQFQAGADIATRCIRSVLTASQFETLDFECTRQAAMEGIGVLEMRIETGDQGDPDIGLFSVFGDDFFYDPRSFRPDFSDARYMGIAKWLDVEEAIELFPDQEDELRTLMVETGFDLTTHSDREFKWIYVNEKRLRLVEHWYKHRGNWYWAFYCSMILLAQGESPFRDERGRPENKFIAFSAAVDHEGDRYGFVRTLKGAQDEINQRRSKALHLSNARRMLLQKGAVDDVEIARREAARADGVVEFNRGAEAPAFEDATSQAQLASQFNFLADAKAEIDAFAPITPQLLTSNMPERLPGVVVDMLHRMGVAELGSFVLAYRAWKLNIYRKVWNACRHVWTQPRWVPFLSDGQSQQFLQVNGWQVGPDGTPQLVNQIARLNVQITLDEGPSVESLMNEVYTLIKDDPTIPFQVKVEFMPISGDQKQRIRTLMQADPQTQAMQQRHAQLEMEKTGAEIGEKRAGTVHRLAQAQKAATDAHSNIHDIFSTARPDLFGMTPGSPPTGPQPGQGGPPPQLPGPPPPAQPPPPSGGPAGAIPPSGPGR